MPESRFVLRRAVEFAETDMAGILHFSNYFRFMEAVEHAFFRSLGFRVHGCERSGVWGWARGRADCDFRRPLRYEDEVDLELVVIEKRRSSLRYQITFRIADGEPSDAVVAVGTLTAVCVDKDHKSGTIRAIPMPAIIDQTIEVAAGFDQNC